MNKKLKSQKGITIVKLVLIIFAVIVLICVVDFIWVKVFGKENVPDYIRNGHYITNDVNNDESSAYVALRNSVSTGVSLKYMDFIRVRNFVKKLNMSNEWFSRETGTFYGKIEDNDGFRITKICDGEYCAMLVVKFVLEDTYNERVNGGYYLVDYNFFKVDNFEGLQNKGIQFTIAFEENESSSNNTTTVVNPEKSYPELTKRPTPTPTPKPTPAPAKTYPELTKRPNTNNSSSTYQSIYNEYAQKLRQAGPTSSINEMAEILNDGIGKMASYMWRAKGTDGQYATYEKWAGKLMDVYLENCR